MSLIVKLDLRSCLGQPIHHVLEGSKMDGATFFTFTLNPFVIHKYPVGLDSEKVAIFIFFFYLEDFTGFLIIKDM